MPTANYEGCSAAHRFIGESWEVDTVWTVCLAYVPLFGCTGLRGYPEIAYRYYPDGSSVQTKWVDL